MTKQIPLTWSNKPLEELCYILDKQRKPISKGKRKAGPFPYYGATGIVDHVSEYLFDEPLVLIGEDGAKWGAGDRSAFKIEGKTWVNNHAHVLKPKRDFILDDWLTYYLNASDLSDYITGATVPKLNQAKLKTINIPIPPLDEQKRIVSILDQAFEGLDRARANAEANLESSQELFASQLSIVMFERLANEPKALMSDICDLITDGKHGDSKNQANSGYYFLSAKDVKRNKLNYEGARQITKEDFEETHKRTNLTAGDILVTNAGTIGRIAIAQDIPQTQQTTFQKSVAVIKPKKQLVRSEFLALGLEANLSNLIKMSSGTAQKNLLLRDLRAFAVHLPQSVELQSQIANEIEEFRRFTNQLVELYFNKLDEITQLKQSLLQKAFLGELT